MARTAALLLLIAYAASNVLALICNPQTYPYAGKGEVYTTLTQKQAQSTVPAFAGITVRIAASIAIIDGCTFELRNISAENLNENFRFQFMGAKNIGDTLASTISEQVLSAPGGNLFNVAVGQRFTLTSVPGRESSFYDFKEFVLFSTAGQFVLATAPLPADGNFTPPIPGGAPLPPQSQPAGGPAPTSPAASNPSSSAPAAPVATTTTRSSATKLGVGMSLISLVAGFFAL